MGMTRKTEPVDVHQVGAGVSNGVERCRPRGPNRPGAGRSAAQECGAFGHEAVVHSVSLDAGVHVRGLNDGNLAPGTAEGRGKPGEGREGVEEGCRGPSRLIEVETHVSGAHQRADGRAQGAGVLPVRT